MANLYIFGSGFLCEMGYPLGDQMYDRFHYFCNQVSQQTHLEEKPLKYANDISIIESEYLASGKSDINKFMNWIDDEENRKELRIKYDEGYLKRYFALPYIIHDYFWNIHRNPYGSTTAKELSCCLDKFVAMKIKRGDIILNFNYDLEIEKRLNDIRKDWLYGYDKDKVSIIKIHGSINWFKGNADQILRYADKKIIYDKPLKEMAKEIGVESVWEIGYYDYLRDEKNWADQALPVTIPPVNADKAIESSEYKDIFKHLIKVVKGIEENAIDRIYTVGYSFGDDDKEICDIIAEKFSKVQWEKPVLKAGKILNENIKKKCISECENIKAIEWLKKFL